MTDPTTKPSAALTIPARHRTREVRIGSLTIGGDHPILIQSMTISDTMNTDAVVAEIRELVDAGCPLVRLTAPSNREAENLAVIKKRLKADGIHVPLVADIHFTPNAALIAADHVEKVRVNPGNYADRKKFKVFEVTDAMYAEGLDRVREKFVPLVRRLKTNGAALRIGTNHGSLSDRVMNRYGDTPEGMVESALEFARMCADEGYHDIVFSMKSSIPSVMIAAYRLLVQRMDAEGMDYPLHVGVTEAGDGLEGRIKSGVGIGSLLASGIGDTIRVSLTEDSRHEIAAAQNILTALERETSAAPRPVEPIELWRTLPVQTAAWRRVTTSFPVGPVVVGDGHPVRVELAIPIDPTARVISLHDPDAERLHRALESGSDGGVEIVSLRFGDDVPDLDALARLSEWIRAAFGPRGEERTVGVALVWPDTDPPSAAVLELLAPVVDLLDARAPSRVSAEPPSAVLRRMAAARMSVRWRLPVNTDLEVAVPHLLAGCEAAGMGAPGFLCEPGPHWLARMRALGVVLASVESPIFLEVPAFGATMPMLAGSAVLDGLGDALCLVGPDRGSGAPEGEGVDDASPLWPAGGVAWIPDALDQTWQLLQACRSRLIRAEFIACPSCGRTQFDLQTTTARIRARTHHLKGVKIAIMGCIVNGPGEMADADFGYVGSGKGMIDLYVGKERVERNLPESGAEDRLVALIDEHGRWVDP